MVDVERWPEWTASVRRLTRTDTGPFGPGSLVRIEQPKLRPADWKVTAFEPGRTFTWVTRSVSLLATGTHSIAPIAGGTRATLSIQFDGLLARPVTWISRGLIERYLGMEAAGLKKQSEQETSR